MINNAVRDLEEKLLDATFRESTRLVGNLLSDDCIEYSSSGCIYGKHEILHALQNEVPIKRKLKNFNTKKLAEDTVLATYILASYNDNDVENSSSLRSSIWQLNGNTWQMIFHQGTVIKDAVELESYNNAWPTKALQEIQILKERCDFDWVCDVQHFGSTAVIGLKAKPIIDIMIGVTEVLQAKKLIPVLTSMGYLFWDENPKKDRLFFVKGMPPFGEKRTHHVHVFEVGSYAWIARQTFKDYLNQNEKERGAYCRLKTDLATKFKDDRELYTSAKSEFVNSRVKKALSAKSQIVKNFWGFC